MAGPAPFASAHFTAAPLAGWVCHFPGCTLPGAPRVLALAQPSVSGSPEASRHLARQRARQLLAQDLANALGAPPDALLLSDQRGQTPHAHWRQGTAPPEVAQRLAGTGLSISHSQGLSLVAWRWGGRVGVDVQALSEAPPSLAERQALAALYLGPQALGAALSGLDFLLAWVQLEARLKALGEPLQAWNPALGQRLARCTSQTLHGPDSSNWVAAVAWPSSAA